MASALLFDFGDTLAYLWVPKAERFDWLCRQSGISLDRSRARIGAIAFERVFSEPTESPSLGWRGSLAAFTAGLAGAGVRDAPRLAEQLFKTAQGLPSELHPDPQAHEVLQSLQAQGRRLGVVSNHVGRLEANLEELGLRGYFDVALDSGILGMRKPDARIFRLACETLRVDPRDALNVGDEPRADVLGAAATGLGAILIDPLGAYGPGYRSLPCRRVARLGDVPRALAKGSAGA